MKHSSIEYSQHIFTQKKLAWFAWEFLAEKMKTGLMHDLLLNFRDLWEQRWYMYTFNTWNKCPNFNSLIILKELKHNLTLTFILSLTTLSLCDCSLSTTSGQTGTLQDPCLLSSAGWSYLQSPWWHSLVHPRNRVPTHEIDEHHHRARCGF